MHRALQTSRCAYKTFRSDWSFYPPKGPLAYVWRNPTNSHPGWRLNSRGDWTTIHCFQSALQMSKANTVNLLSEFTETYNGLNDILKSLYKWCFIFYFNFQSRRNLEMSPLEVSVLSIQDSCVNKLGGIERSHCGASLDFKIFNFYWQLLANVQRIQRDLKIPELCSRN